MTDTATQANESTVPAIAFQFSNVAKKDDGSYVVTMNECRSHVTRDYNLTLFNAVEDYLVAGGEFSVYDEDVFVEADPFITAKIWIEKQLQTSDQVVSEYRDARDLGEQTAVTSAQFSELLAWRQAVRAWSQVEGYPGDATKPPVPGWLTLVLQHVE